MPMIGVNERSSYDRSVQDKSNNVRIFTNVAIRLRRREISHFSNIGLDAIGGAKITSVCVLMNI
jgi:hypothetical protein